MPESSCSCHINPPCSFCVEGGNEICGYCGRNFATAEAKTVFLPGEKQPGSEFVHKECQEEAEKEAGAFPWNKDIKQFYITFGQKYRGEVHPTGGHPDGYFTVLAKDNEQARERIYADCGSKWSMIYDEEPDRGTYPLGSLRTIE